MRHLHRLAAVLAAGALIVTIPGAASAAPDDRSAGWLSRQLTDGLMVFPEFSFTDFGMTADAGGVLDAAGGHADDLSTIRGALEENADAWTGDAASGDAGSTAKAIVLAKVTGANPRDFGGIDLVTRLEGRISTAEPIVGRMQDVVDPEDEFDVDYANTIGQAIGARGLARVGSDLADEVLAYLLKQQCNKGYFRLYFTGDRAAPRQGCDAGDAAPDTDATALAVLNLVALPKAAKTKKVRNAVADAVAWLKATQKKNGSFGGGTATEGSNSNSTGLAAQALGVTGACGRAERAAAWVEALQVSGDVSGTPLAGERGGIAYNRAAFRVAKEEGIVGDAARYEWRKATVDAAGALRFLSCG